MIGFVGILIVFAALCALVGVSMSICAGLDRVFRLHSQLPQLSYSKPVKVKEGEYIRLLDNTLLWVQDGDEKDPHLIAAMEEVEEICSR